MNKSMSARGGSASGGKKYLIIFLVIYNLLAQVNLAYAQAPGTTGYDYSQNGTNPISSEIEKYLCAPAKDNQGNYLFTGRWGYVGSNSDSAAGAGNKASGDLYNCINKLYRFALVICSVIAVFFIVLAGFRYMSAEGSQETVDKAKDMVVTSITALVILFAGYILLRAINPDLIEFKNIQPPSVTGLEQAPAPIKGSAGWENAPPSTQNPTTPSTPAPIRGPTTP